MTMSYWTLLSAAALALAPVGGTGDATRPRTTTAPPAAPQDKPVPFGVGERLEYDVRFGPVKVGSGSMEVLERVSVRGRETWHTRFRLKGGTLFYKVDDRYESWMDTETLASLRFKQEIDQGRYERERTFEIYPDRRIFIEQVDGKAPKDPQPSVAQPLDDGSFIYFIRSLPELEVGKTYTFDNYFRPDRNPVKITVLRRERVQVPAGTFDAVVVRPEIKTKGIFSKDGEAEIWLADGPSRIVLQLKSKLSFGSLNLYLRSYRPPTTATAAAR